MKNAKSKQESYTIRNTIFVFLMFMASVYFLLPFFWIIVASTKSSQQLFNTNPFLFVLPFEAVKNFIAVSTFNGGIIWRWFLNSAIYAGSISFGTTLISAMAGFAFSKYNFRGKNMIFFVILGTIMVPFTALVLPIYLLMHALNFVNTYWGVILPSLVNPFSVYLMRIFWTQQFPNELLDAARIDGASELKIFFSVGLPIVKGGIATVALFTFVGAWNNFFLPLVILSKENLYPLTLGLQVWVSITSSNVEMGLPYPALLMGTLISIVPLIFAFIFLRKYWQYRLSAGAVKG